MTGTAATVAEEAAGASEAEGKATVVAVVSARAASEADPDREIIRAVVAMMTWIDEVGKEVAVAEALGEVKTNSMILTIVMN